MDEVLTPDICVLGAGSGGLAVAMAAARAGRRVLLVEKDRLGGGGQHRAVPAQALVAAARRAAAVAGASRFGVMGARPKIDFMRVHDHVQGVVAALAPNVSAARLASLGIGLLTGEASFADPETLRVGTVTIRPARTVIATGSVASVPEIEGIGEVPVLTDDTIFDLRVCPRHLAVLGADPHGLALAQGFLRLGADVTVIAGEVLPGEDPDCVSVLCGMLARGGMAIRVDSEVARVRRARGKILIEFAESSSIEASHILVAGERRPNVEGLGLESARIRVEPRGIPVDGTLRTSNRNVFAIGDVTRAPKYAHTALHHADVVTRQLVHGVSATADEDILPRYADTDPQYARIGLTEQQARERRHEIRVARWPFCETERATAERTPDGHVKVLTTPQGRIIGATIVGGRAADTITTWSLAIAQGLSLADVTGLIVPFGSYAVPGVAAGPLRTSGLTPSLRQRIMRGLRRRN